MREGPRPFSFNANKKKMTKHVFPLFLDGDIQTVASDGAWNGLTSRIELDGAFNLQVPSNVVVDPGTMVSMKNDTGSGINVTFNPDPFGDVDTNVEAVDNKTIYNVMYVSPEIGWIPLGTVTLT